MITKMKHYFLELDQIECIPTAFIQFYDPLFSNAKISYIGANAMLEQRNKDTIIHTNLRILAH